MSTTIAFCKIPLSLSQLSLAAVLQCGQSFRWSIFPLAASEGQEEAAQLGQPSHEYRLCLRDRVICLRQSQEALLWNAVFPNPPTSTEETARRDAETIEWINDYFQLDIDLQELYRTWSERDPIFNGLQERFSGIRILRQDPWENLISFICSSNNNISRISKMVKSLCANYSPFLLALLPPSGSGEPEPYHPFPPPSVLAASEVATKLRTLGFGYRADFIQKTAKMLVERNFEPSSSKLPSAFYVGQEPAEVWLAGLRNEQTAVAREELTKLMGVGRKVADCVLLMSLDKREVVPVDTHVHQIAHKHYGVKMPSAKGGKIPMTPKLYEEVATKLADVWGDYAGWAHSVLFTSDLKSFADYGTEKQTPVNGTGLLTPEDTPEPTPTTKRKRGGAKVEVKVETTDSSQQIVFATAIVEETYDDGSSTLTLAERVKRRRRTKT
ncbi:DNA glycosylase [Thelephora ganbajun]|uniref:DNA glycosylase n=1 Tax=Thelephora ganbajun TaxID=370292 RepID=A0ACB6ZCQ3_THEGA|nr:DNA glycosylase [Thelephora ganbajun]